MSLRDEFKKLIEDYKRDPELMGGEAQLGLEDILLGWLEQKLTEAQAETVERCLEHLEKARKVFSLLPDLNCHEIKLIDALTVGIRALSADCGWLERQTRTAYIEGVKSAYVQHDHAIAGVCGAACPLKLRDLRVADLERQLAALPKGARQ